MSTKIYDAYEFNGSLVELLDICIKVRQEFLKRSVKKVLEIVPKYSSFTELRKYLEEQVRSGLREEFNFLASVMVFPYGYRLYIKFFGVEYPSPMPMNEIEKLFGDKIEDFHYQNSTDKPDEVSKEDWKMREILWNQILKTNTFSENGFVYELYGEIDCFTVAMDAIREYNRRKDLNESSSV